MATATEETGQIDVENIISRAMRAQPTMRDVWFMSVAMAAAEDAIKAMDKATFARQWGTAFVWIWEAIQAKGE